MSVVIISGTGTGRPGVGKTVVSVVLTARVRRHGSAHVGAG